MGGRIGRQGGKNYFCLLRSEVLDEIFNEMEIGNLD